MTALSTKAPDAAQAYERAGTGTRLLGWRLPAEDRDRLMALCPPRYADVFAHHVTLRVRVSPRAALPPETEARVVGRADDCGSLEALVVEIGGTTRRPDGSTYHITWSLDRAAGRTPVQSNDVIRSHGFERWPEPIQIRLEPALMD